MPEPILSFGNGRATALDILRRSEGVVEKGINFIYMPNDPDRPHLMPGRTVSAALPSSVNPKGVVHAQFDDADDQIVVLANGKLYETNAQETLGAFNTVQDVQGTPADIPVTGNYLKALPGLNNDVIFYSGAANERPLVRDMDGNWRKLGLRKPDVLALDSILASLPTESRPSSDSGDFSDGSLAYDADKKTFAAGSILNPAALPATVTHTFTFSGGGTPAANERLYVELSGSGSRPDQDYDNFVTRERPPLRDDLEDTFSKVLVEYSIDSGGTWATLRDDVLPLGRKPVSADVSGAATYGAIRVRVTLTTNAGTLEARVHVFDVYTSTGGGTGAITEGDYYYVVTEVYRKVLANQTVVEVESEPCDDELKVTISGTQYGVKLTLPSLKNQPTEGYAAEDMYFRVYRSTSTGVWPNLGQIVELPSTETTYIDNFEVSGTVLATPTLHTAGIGSTLVNAAGLPPAFVDATLYRGALIVIPVNTSLVRWSLPGMMEYFPFGQAFSPASGSRVEKPLALATVGDENLLIFLRTKVIRILALPLAPGGDFNLAAIQIDDISPDYGLAGTPKSYSSFHYQDGRPMVAWVSDNGIWATDGTLASERGVGIVNLTSDWAWEDDVDVTRLDETTLTYDPILRCLYFDCYNPDGILTTYTLHAAKKHWVNSGEGAVPKSMGPHTPGMDSRVIGVMEGKIRHWAMNVARGNLYNERTGTDDAGAKMIGHLESPWKYPAGGGSEYQIDEISLVHSDWGAGERGSIEIQARREDSGEITSLHLPEIPLNGDRISSEWVDKSCHSLRAIVRYEGKTTSLGKPFRAIGPILLEGKSLGKTEED